LFPSVESVFCQHPSSIYATGLDLNPNLYMLVYEI
jgi:hypothetical protein